MRRLLLILLFLLLATTDVGAVKLAVGTYAGNSTDDRTIDISATSSPSVADFQPDVCMVKGNDAAQQPWIRLSNMPDDTSVAPNTQVHTTNRIQRFNANGFQVGNNAATNGTGITYYYVCWGADGSGDLAVGSYVGDGNTARTIDISDTSLGGVADFSPVMVWVLGSGIADDMTWRVTANATDESMRMTASPHVANRIQAFNANGFEVGNDQETNTATGTPTYYYFALKAVTNGTASNGYTGSAGADNRSISGAGFQPEVVLVKENGTAATKFRTSAMAGDFSCGMRAEVCAVDSIQAFESDGFQVGTLLNNDTVAYDWFAQKQAAVAAVTTRRAPILIQ